VTALAIRELTLLNFPLGAEADGITFQREPPVPEIRYREAFRLHEDIRRISSVESLAVT